MSVTYTVLTPRRIVTVVSESNFVGDITKAIKAAGIDPFTVQAITPVEQ